MNKKHLDYTLDVMKRLLACDSPTGFTRQAAEFFKGEILIVVVARHEHLFDTTSVNSLVVREYRIPSRADMAQLFRQTLIHNVAGYYNAVNLLRIKPLQCPDERIKAPARFADVRVAQDTHAKIRFRLRRKCAHIWHSRERQHGFDEVSSAHWCPSGIFALITEQE